MAHRSTLVKPLVEQGSTRRRSRTTDDRPNVSVDTPRKDVPLRPSMPGSRSCPILIDEGEDADRTTTPVKQARQTARIQDDTSKLRPASAQKPRPQQPKTPGRARPQPARESASDPGVRRARQETYQDKPIVFLQNGKFPCGRKAYQKSGGAWEEKHRSTCEKCQSQQSGQDGTEESAGNGDFTLPTRMAASSNSRDVNDSNFEANDRNATSPEKKPTKPETDNSALLVHHRLLQAAKEKLTTSEKKGYLYIFSSSEHPGLLKLGCSVNPPTRGKQHRERCGLTVTWVYVSNCAQHMKRAEKLAKLDLAHLQQDYQCASCAHTHAEWFAVAEDRAKHVVARWIDWVNDQNPYSTPQGALAPVWEWLLDFPRAPRPAFGERDHEARWAHWDAALRPVSSGETERFKARAKPALGAGRDRGEGVPSRGEPALRSSCSSCCVAEGRGVEGRLRCCC